MALSKSDVENYLIKVLSSDSDGGLVIALKGKWGVGKTYFIKNLLKKICKDTGKKGAYVSLFGKNSIDEINATIVLQLFTWNKGISMIRRLLDVLKGSFSKIFNIHGTVLTLTPSILSSFLSLLERKDFGGAIIIIDDFERSQIDVKQVFGLASQLRDEKACKIILVFNEDEILKSHSESEEGKVSDYKRYKEKAIDMEITFNPAFEENLSLLYEIGDRNGEDDFVFSVLKDYFLEIKGRGYEENNLRILFYVYSKLKELNFLLTLDLDESLRKDIFKTMAFLFYIKRHHDLAISSLAALEDLLREERLERFKRIAKVQDKKETNEMLKWFDKLKPKSNILDKFDEDFFAGLLQFWESEVISESLKETISKNLEIFIEKLKRISDFNKKRNFLKEEYENYLVNLSYRKEEFVRNIWNFLLENKEDLLTIVDLNTVSFLIGKLIKYDPENSMRYRNFTLEIIKEYIESIPEERKRKLLFDKTLGFEGNLLYISELLNIKEKVWQIISTQKETCINSFLNCDNLFVLLEELINSLGMDEFDLEIIRFIHENPDKLKNCFLKKGDLSLLVKFLKISYSFETKNQDHPLSMLRSTMISIIKELLEFSEYKEKVSELIKYLNLRI